MNCGFCGKPFEEDKSLPACRQCPVGSGCGLVRCPHCGYENPGTPGWIAFLRRKLGGEGRPRPIDEQPSARSAAVAAAAGSTGLALPMLRPGPGR